VPAEHEVQVALAHMRLEMGADVLLCEGGPDLNGQLFAIDAVDEFFLTLGPVVVSGRDSKTPVEGDLPFARDTLPRFSLEQQLRATQARLEISEVARELKVKPRTAEKLILNAVTFSDDGTPTNVRALLEAEIAADPNLVDRPAATSTPANGDSGRRNGKTLTLEDVRAMTPDQINARWAEIEPLMAGSGVSR
jgi:hypothetical protein